MPDHRRARRIAINVAVLVAILLGIRWAVGGSRPARGQSETDDAGSAGSSTSREAHARTLADRPPRVQTAEDIEGVEDPAILRRAGEYHLAQGNGELARACLEASLRNEELSHYFDFESQDAFRALVHERMGEAEQAATAWNEGVERNLLHTYLLCRLFSEAADRETRLEEMRAELRRRVAAAEAGEEVHWYTTRKGASRKLAVIDQEELIRQAREMAAGERKSIRYVYIPELDLAALPSDLPVKLEQSAIGSLRGYGADREAVFGLEKGFVLDEFHLGKRWSGKVNRSRVIPPARLGEAFFTEVVVLPDAHLEGVQLTGRNASFFLTAFEGHADFSASRFGRVADFRYTTFHGGASFRRTVFDGQIYFGHAVFDGPADFGIVVVTSRRGYFDSTRFGDTVDFEAADLRQGGSFENAGFDGRVDLSRASFGARVNMSRTTFSGTLIAREMVCQGMDFFGTTLSGTADFTDSVFDGHVRFSPDEVTYRDYAGKLDELHTLYKMYQGDEDATEDLTSRSAYGVETIDDLTAYIPGDLSFANVMFQEFCQFQRVTFGEAGGGGTAGFYNTQFRGETHFERAEFFGDSDFTTIFANELGLNEAIFHGRLMLDDANVPGRITLTGASFVGEADLSLYGAQINRFHVSKEQLEERKGRHRLFYERCAQGRVEDVSNDPRIVRALDRYREGDEPPEVGALCYSRLVDDFNVLNNAFGELGMPKDEDWAYWYGSHHDTMATLKHGSLGERANGLLRWFLFELLFGWGVNLQNLGLAALFVVLIYTCLYKWFTPNAQIEFNGFDTTFRHLTYVQTFYLSLLSLLSMDIGWGIGPNKGFRWLNLTEVALGIIILTFFVGAYTRLVLA